MNHDRLVQALTKHEGLRYKPYVDTTGNLTVGVGHNLTANGLPDKIVWQLLEYDVAAATQLLNEHLPWWRDLGDGPQNALVELAFNLGPVLLSFTTFLQLAQSGDLQGAAKDLLQTKWADQVGSTRANDVAQELLS